MKILSTVAAFAMFGSQAGAQYDVYGVRFAGLAAFPMNALVLHADSTRKQELAFIVWALRPAGDPKHAVLFDAGFYRDKFVQSWKPTNFQKPSEAIAKIGLAPDAITDVIISHIHWDHVDGADLFPRARVWIQKDEYDHYVDANGLPKSRTVDTADAAMLAQLKKAGRLRLIDGDGREIIPGITVYTGGRHTYASQYIGVRTAKGIVVLASDNAYTYENLNKHAPIAQTFSLADTIANVAAQDRMRHIASDPNLIVPGHDPEIFTRFPTPGSGVAKVN
ncbi:MAG TPA: N-acyl homoserine lactonase family protein [Gemmatimonadaceae bacterium]|nr:N-acyl homoserine lactonase family protein [Gemmatimonadaceae bacterium]